MIFINRIKNTVPFVLAVLTACSGSGSETGVSDTPAANSVLSAERSTLVLPGVVTADFSAHPELFGERVSIGLIKNDKQIDDISNEAKISFGISFNNDEAIIITVSKVPESPVPVTINADGLAEDIFRNHFPGVIAMSLDGGDEAPFVEQLNSTSSITSKSIKAAIPTYFFQQVDGSTYVAHLRVTFFSTIPPPISKSDSSSSLYLPCPLVLPVVRPDPGSFVSPPDDTKPRCTERSRFNLVRYIPDQVKRPHSHLGIDLVANETPVYVPAGGNPINGSSRSVPGRGIWLEIAYGDYRIKLYHLSSISKDMLNQDGSVNTSATTIYGGSVATSGRSGGVPPHLHYELWVRNQKICPEGQECAAGFSVVDPFPYLAKYVRTFDMSHSSGLEGGKQYPFRLAASDLNGNPIESDVHSPYENNGVAPKASMDRINYDPTRKTCLRLAETVTSVQLPQANNVDSFNGIDGSICNSWMKGFVVKGLAYTPAANLIFKFSNNAAINASADPLSIVSTEYLLAAEPTDCLSLTFSFSGDSCTVFGGIAASKSEDIKKVRFQSSAPQVATTSVSGAWQGEPENSPYFITLGVTAGQAAGNATLEVYIEDKLEETFVATNKARQP